MKKKIISLLSRDEKEFNLVIPKQNVFWMIGIFAQGNNISIDLANLFKSLPEQVKISDFPRILKEFNVHILDEDFSSGNLHFCVLNLTEGKDAEQEISIIHQDDKGASFIVHPNGTKEPLENRLNIVKIFRLQKKVDIFDFSDKAIKEDFGFKWFLKEMFNYKQLWMSVVVWSLLMQCVSFALPLMTQTVVDKVIVNQAQTTLIALTIGVFIFNLFNLGFNWARQKMILFVGNKIDNTLAIEVVAHLLRLPTGYFQKRSTGTTIARVHAIETIREFLAGSFITLVLDFPFVIIFLIVMLHYSILLTGITLAFVAVMLILSIFVAPIIRAKAMQVAQMSGKIQAFLTEYVSGVETVKSLQMEAILLNNYKQDFSEYLGKAKNVKSASINYNTVMTWLEQTLSLLILGVGAYLSMTSNSGFTIGMLIAFQMFSSRVTQPLLRIASMWQEFQQTQISMIRLKDIMDQEIENYSMIENVVLEKKGSISLKGLSFAYDRKTPLYKNFNLEINSGELVMIHGESGCGKSTLAKLLQGFYLNYIGDIEINGINIKKLSVLKLRNIMGTVPQETVLFSGTIFDNFKLVKLDATLEEVANVCKLAGIHDVIQGLPDGYQTELGERGTGLSGGQRQRIAIARALIRNPSILIFDEAVSSLDAESSKIIGETINLLKGKITIIFITHVPLANIVADKTVKMVRAK